MFVLFKIDTRGEEVEKFIETEEIEKIEDFLRQDVMESVKEPWMLELSDEELREEITSADLYIALRDGKPNLEELIEATDGFTWGQRGQQIFLIEVSDGPEKEITKQII